VNVFAVLVDRHKKVFNSRIFRVLSTKCGKCFGGPKKAHVMKLLAKKTCQKKFIICPKDFNFKSHSLIKYTLNSAKASINIYAVQFEFSRQFPKNIYQWIGPLSSLPMLCLPFCSLFCGDQPNQQIHSPLVGSPRSKGYAVPSFTVCEMG
jgi:hypothetical protein